MPITELQLTALMFRVIFSTCCFFLTLMFFIKIINAKKTGIEISPFLGTGLLIFFYGITHICWMFHDYYIYEYGLSVVNTPNMLDIYKVAIITGFCGIIGLVFICEKILGKTKYLFTIFSIISCIYSVFFLFKIDQIRLVTYISMPISSIIVIITCIYTIFFKTKGFVRKRFVFAFLGLAGFFVFYLVETEAVMSLLGLSREIASIISTTGSIGSFILWASIFLSFETFTEFDWTEKLRELFIIAPNGATLFHYSFMKKPILPAPDLISSGLTGIKDILAEMVQSTKVLKVVDHQDVKIIFEYGTYSTIALIADENFKIYHSKLTLLIAKFENLFQDFLSHWHGEVEVFIPSGRLIEEIFS